MKTNVIIKNIEVNICNCIVLCVEFVEINIFGYMEENAGCTEMFE